jgi:uncharacterized protein (UPF0332 family)
MAQTEINEYIAYRINKAEEVYTAAVILYDAGQWNSAINRLYYACFYVASALLLKRGVGAKSHAGVIAKFSECVVRTGEVTADEYRVFSKLLNWRTKGDYNDMFDFSKEDVDDILQPTRQFIDKVKTLL